MITLDESSLPNVSINESANYRNLSSYFEWPWPEPPNFLETMLMAQSHKNLFKISLKSHLPYLKKLK